MKKVIAALVGLVGCLTIMILLLASYIVVDKVSSSIERVQNDYKRDGWFVTAIRFLREPRDRESAPPPVEAEPLPNYQAMGLTHVKLLKEGDKLQHSEAW